MQTLIDKGDSFDKILLISGDGDFKILVDYLIKKERFLKILFPSKKFASSMYKNLDARYYDILLNLKGKISYKNKS